MAKHKVVNASGGRRAHLAVPHGYRSRARLTIQRSRCLQLKVCSFFQALFVAPAEDELNQAVAAELCRNGWNAKKAANEEDAIRMFGASLPNVLVLDARRRRKTVDNWDPCHVAQ